MCLPFLKSQRLADSHGCCYPIHLVEWDRLQFVIPEGLTCLIFDKVTNELVGSVACNFSKAESLLEWVCSIVQEGVDTRKSVWLEDSGSLVLIGFTAGNISLPSFTGESLTFSDIEFGLGCMVFAQQYARPMHYEFQPHDWSVMWTTLHDGTNPGGNNFSWQTMECV
ncbi:hypothetical protein BKA70DRAFT_1431051 [Coprinopsis sp. MPI-PUGE-AT-0042]|nr:hypothetical protein BKA70DRAFT_1431051 [Coprinopsis sp. MPI-PUGE-AT-0042]